MQKQDNKEFIRKRSYKLLTLEYEEIRFLTIISSRKN